MERHMEVEETDGEEWPEEATSTGMLAEEVNKLIKNISILQGTRE